MSLRKILLGGLCKPNNFSKHILERIHIFSKSIDKISSNDFHDSIRRDANSILQSLKDYVQNDLHRTMTYEREIQLETVSDYLEQAERLLNDNKVHPAAAAVIIGASLEEFLRNWLEETGFDISSIKNGIDAYAKELKILEKINKQDV